MWNAVSTPKKLPRLSSIIASITKPVRMKVGCFFGLFVFPQIEGLLSSMSYHEPVNGYQTFKDCTWLATVLVALSTLQGRIVPTSACALCPLFFLLSTFACNMFYNIKIKNKPFPRRAYMIQNFKCKQ